jgi:hypothetical protein
VAVLAGIVPTHAVVAERIPGRGHGDAALDMNDDRPNPAHESRLAMSNILQI